VRAIRLSDRVLLAGMTGKGKTVFARYLVERMQPVRTIVFDPKGELEFPGVTPCRNVEQLEARIREAFVHYIPPSFNRDQLEDACQIVWSIPGPYIWWVDEGAEVSTPGWCPEGLRLCATQGRQPEKMLIVLTQRLTEIHPVFRTQSEHMIMFVPAPIMLDLKTMAGHVNREWRELEQAFNDLHEREGDYSHLWFVRETNELRWCAPLQPTGHVPASVGTSHAAEEVLSSAPCED
jgi:hypothetical protein